MSSAIKASAILWIGCAALSGAGTALRVCADPDNLPYSNQRQQGFENELARMIASDFGTGLSYTWFAQRGNFFRKTLGAGVCDLVMGVPAGMQSMIVTQPYYRSGYVFVSRRDRNLDVHSLDDPRLRQVRIGVHILGDSANMMPPVQALTSRGIVQNLVGYNIFGNLYQTDPSGDLIRAVESCDVDLAVAWGPIAGYFARQSPIPLRVVAIDSDPSNPALPLAFDIGIGLRSADRDLERRLDTELDRRRSEIRQLLRSFGIPERAPAHSVPAER